MSKPKNLFIVRHGQSIGNIDWRWYLKLSELEIYLTPKGKRQAFAAAVDIGKAVDIDNAVAPARVAVYTSHYKRAKETSDIIVDYFGSRVDFYRVDTELRELKWTGDNIKHDKSVETDNRERMKKFRNFNQGGESAHDVYLRMGTAISNLNHDFKHKQFPSTAIIVSHGLAIKCLLMRLLGWDEDMYESIQHPKNGQVFHLQLSPNRTSYKLISNET